MELAKIQRERAVDAVYQALRQAIVSSLMKPGERLKVDELAQKLGVSLTPVRSAIQQLANEGLVEIRPRSGTFVASLSPQDVEETFEIRCALECLAGEKAAANVTPAALKRLHELLRLLRKPVRNDEDRKAHERDNSELHRTIVEAAGSRRLLEMYEALNAHIKIARIHSAEANWPTRMQQEEAEHEQIVAALAQRDADAIVQALRKHIYRAKDALVATLRRQMRIAAIQAIPVRLPREREKAVRTAGSPTPLVEGAGDYRWSAVFPVLYAVHFETALVKVTLDNGLVGWGEAQAPLAPEVACVIVDKLLQPILLGAEFDGSIARIERLWDQMYSTMRVRGQTGGFMLDAISGVDLALWDLAGKIQQQPVSALIPGSSTRTEVTAYYSGIPGATVEARVENALRQRDQGFGNFKIFYDCGRDEFLEAFSALRRALGPNVGLAVDALWRLTPDDAQAFGLELDQGGALWLEAPLPPEDPLAHAALARSIRTPLAIGESYRTRYELAPFFRERALGFVQPDLGRCGLTESLRIAAVAAGAGIPVVPHLSIAMGPQIAAAIHFAAAIPNCDLLEYNPNVLEMANRFLAEPLECRGGRYSVPQRPGLGCDLISL